MSRTTIPLVAVLLALSACNGDDDGQSGETGGSSTDSSSGSGSTTSADSTDTGPTDECGNDMIDDGEECDGVDLGGLGCTDVNPNYDGGTLACGASCTFDASGCTLPPGTALVALNEMTSNSIADGRGPNDAIELFNAGDAAADLSGWKLSDDATFPPEKTYVFPAGSTLAPGAFQVLLSFDATTMSGVLPFGISDDSDETIAIADADGAIVDTVSFAGNLARVSYCRVPDGNGPWDQCEQTFGAMNVLAATACGNGVIEDDEACDTDDLGGATCGSVGLGFSGGTLTCSLACNLDIDACTTSSDLVLNELSALSDEIEIFNGGDAMIELDGWVLTDDDVDATYDPMVDTAELVFPAGTTLAPGDYLVVVKGTGPGEHPFGLALEGDRVTLLDPTGPTIIDHTNYGNMEAGAPAPAAPTSFCRQPDGPGGVWTPNCDPTMGAAN